MFTYAELWPDPPQPFRHGPDPFVLRQSSDDSTLVGRLKRLYEGRMAQYERELSAAVRSEAGKGTATASAYPEIPLPGLPGARPQGGAQESYVIVFDRELFRQLFDLYAERGWSAINAVEAALQARRLTVNLVWECAWRFFWFTERVLYLLIRDALIEIERLAAERLTVQLSQVSVELSNAWARFGFHKVTRTEVLEGPLGASVEVKPWAFRDPAHAKAVYVAMRAAVLQRAKCDALVAGTKEPGDAVRATKKLYEDMRAVIQLNAPLALLALEGMTPKTKQWEMEHAIGRILFEFAQRTDNLGAGIDARESIAALTLWAKDTRRGDPLPENTDEVSGISIESPGPEDVLIERGLSRLDDTPSGTRYFPLICDSMLDTLVETGAIHRDSLAYIVRNHYVVVLNRKLKERRASAKAWEDFWGVFNKLAAGLSLILLATPAAEVSPAVRAVSVLGDRILLAYAVHSTVGQLAALNEALSAQLLTPDALVLEGLARLGELRAYRAEFIDNVEESLVLLVMQMGAGQWAELRPLLTAHGYYGDLRTVLGV